MMESFFRLYGMTPPRQAHKDDTDSKDRTTSTK
jgi:hypothetical protein